MSDADHAAVGVPTEAASTDRSHQLPAAAPGLGAALDELDERVARCGGRVYLTKDVRLRRDLLAAMYPDLHRFHAQRALVDPDGVLRSDLGRRLGLCATAS
jgi:decaprenylphospho-beta-D-ribofuranose 2-oxidase